MARYNITRIVPEGFIHSSGFLEVMDSLAWSLSSLGHEVNITQNWFSEHGETNIIFGCELVADFQRLPKNSIIYNLEQPSHPHLGKVRRLAKESGCQVWDYSHRSIADWEKEGIKAKHVPIGYTPNLTRIPKALTQDIDVLIYGYATPRRNEVAEDLRRSGLNVVFKSACYGGGRDQLISRAKVCLNIHHDGRDRFEIVRCSYLMANGKLVVTEPSSDDDEYESLRNGLSITPYRLIADTCASYCAPSSVYERSKIEEKALELIKLRDYSQAVGLALSDSPQIPTPSRPIEFKSSRMEKRKEFIDMARSLRPKDQRVIDRYKKAQESGDMKDFVGWMKEHAKGNVMEIGTRDGASTSAFLLGVQENGGHVYSCDVDPNCGLLFRGNPQWTFIHADSKDFQKVITQMPFELDVLLIDGDHSRAGVINDIEYARQLRPGGYVLFHDTCPEERPSGCSDMSWPGDDVKTVYESLCASMATLGWTHEELPGRYGMGILRKPPVVVPEVVCTTEEVSQ